MAGGDRTPTSDTEFDGRGLLGPAGTGHAFWVGFVIVSLSIVSALATYFILTGLTPITPRSEVVLGVLFVNVVLILAMMGVLAWQGVKLWRAWRDKVAGVRLHVRIVALFSLIAALPAILLAAGATITFSRSLDGWFSARTTQIIENSLEVASAYLEEHGQIIRTDVVNMAKDLESATDLARRDVRQLRDLVFVQAGLRDLPAAYVIDASGKAVVKAIEADQIPYQPPPEHIIRLAAAGHVPVIRGTNHVAALIRLAGTPGWYLYVARGVSPKVIAHLQRAEAGVAEFEELSTRRGGLKVAHGLMYFMISLTALLAAIWAGLWFASRFVAPIRRLIAAAQQVSRGNLGVALPVIRGEGDLRRLSQTFNTMTRELKTQRDDLIERRQFIEAVLSGVTAGVLDIDADGSIKLANTSAERLLQIPSASLVDRPLGETLPEFAALVDNLLADKAKTRRHDQLRLTVGGEERIFAVRVTTHGDEARTPDQGAVITFDDITELLSAQRTSAWGEVARRIAHEIKNPLTPIQLAAERLRRKYAGGISSDRETFEKLIDTIVRQVGDIKSMVDEFASFARMPKPQMERHDLREAVQEPVLLFRESHPQITFDLEIPARPLLAMFDRRLISQAVTNLVKNAAESIETAGEAADRPTDYKGRIETRVRKDGEIAVIEVIDNGIGLAKHNRPRLLEPYVTTKRKGTGLGLTIVQKVVEQHGGELALEDAAPAPGRVRGAMVRLTLPIRAADYQSLPQPAAAAE